MLPKLKIEDLKLGMRVHEDQLENIYDTWILLQLQNIGDGQGIVRFIGKKPNKESQKILDTGLPIGCIYHDSILLDEDVTFDE